jgi:hypothetical protein
MLTPRDRLVVALFECMVPDFVIRRLHMMECLLPSFPENVDRFLLILYDAMNDVCFPDDLFL